jgi:cell wall-associated NlpC family hydrolase
MSSRSLKLLAVAPFVVGAGVLGLLALMMAAAFQTAGEEPGQTLAAGDCSVTVTGVASPTLDETQLGNARTIIATGISLRIPTRGLIVAIATAMQESTMRNVNYGDVAGPDSRGLFQQRAPWGSLAERMDPATSARFFFEGGSTGPDGYSEPGLLDIQGWESMPVTLAAQAVQRSAFPLAYAKWEPLATRLVGGARSVGGLTCDSDIGVTVGTGAVGDMLRVALAQQGKPYVWGGTGPDSFDCSGLFVYSWREAGFRLTVRTAAQMYANSTPVTAGSEQPGDILFTSFDADGPGHMLIVVRKGLAVQAPRTGDVVKLTPYRDSSRFVIGRIKRSVLEPIPAAA